MVKILKTWLSNGSPLANLSLSPLLHAEKVTNRDFIPQWMRAPMNRLPMTVGGHSALEDELTHRIRIGRPRLIQRIQEAIADDSNLAENSEYQAAKAEQEINEARIAELDDKLARAEIIDVSKLSGDIIKFGATVTVIEESTGKKNVWRIVGEPEADVHKGKISVTSPIARALIGKTKGATVEVEAPSGARVYKVQQVEWIE
jgi:transcription elongation factor GreA